MKRYLIALMLCVSALAEFKADAQHFSLSTNVLDYACLGTMNLEGSFSVSRRLGLTVGVDYNPFTFRKGQPDQFQYRQQSYSLGARIWPWHIWSGWWLAGKMKFQEYNIGGILSEFTDEGDRAGLGLYAGYTYMLGPHFNIEFGLGAWGGMDWFNRYSCQVCGLTEDSGRRWFVLPDDIMIALVYVF